MTDQGADESALLSQIFLRSGFYVGTFGPEPWGPRVDAKVVTVTSPADPEQVYKRMQFIVWDQENGHSSALTLDEVEKLLAALGIMQQKAQTLRNDPNRKGQQQEILFKAKDDFEVRCTSAKLFVASGRTEYETALAGFDAFRQLLTPA